MWSNFWGKGFTNLKNYFKLHIFIDTIKSRNKTSKELKVKKDITIKELRKKISDECKMDMDELVLLIDFRFWEDDKTLKQAVNEKNVIDGGYNVYAVIITSEDEENIDYDIETYLKEKYSSSPIPEPQFVIIDKTTNCPKKEELENIPMVCPRCMTSKKRESMVIMEYCKHEFCRNCLSNALMQAIGVHLKCLQSDCPQILIDFEYQKILGPEKYVQWTTLVNRKSGGDNTFIKPKMGWVCQSCTYLNKPYLKFCDTCSDNRPINYKIPCFYVATKEEELIKQQDEEDSKRSEEEYLREKADMEVRLKELKIQSKESVTVTKEDSECPICGLDYGPGDAIVLHSCLHIVCKECIRNYLLNIEDAQVKCPTEKCVGLVEDREIRELLTAEEYQKYQDLSLRMAEAKEQRSFHCKEVNCTAWIVYEDNVTDFKCPLCGKKNCIRCEAIHDGKTCQEYQMIKLSLSVDPSQSKNDQFIQSMINSGQAMKCPGCKMIVEKNRGCDGVLCRGCGMMICWATKGPRWGPKGKGDRSGGCGCRFMWGRRCHPNCHYCH